MQLLLLVPFNHIKPELTGYDWPVEVRRHTRCGLVEALDMRLVSDDSVVRQLCRKSDTKTVMVRYTPNYALATKARKNIGTVNTDLALQLPPARKPPRKQLRMLELTSRRLSSDMWLAENGI